MGAKIVPTPIVNHVWLEEISFRGFSRKVEKCWQNGDVGGGGDGGGEKDQKQ